MLCGSRERDRERERRGREVEVVETGEREGMEAVSYTHLTLPTNREV